MYACARAAVNAADCARESVCVFVHVYVCVINVATQPQHFGVHTLSYFFVHIPQHSAGILSANLKLCLVSRAGISKLMAWRLAATTRGEPIPQVCQEYLECVLAVNTAGAQGTHPLQSTILKSWIASQSTI